MDNWDFNYDDLSDEEKEEIEREEKAKQKAIRTSPIYKKAFEIYETVNALVESLPEEDKEFHQSILMESAMMLAPKLAGAMGSDSWLICMQNASIIRYHAEYLHTSTSGLRMFTKVEKDYVKILRTEMEEFRELFKEWVKTFDKLEQEEWTDEWGLFLRKS
jgi:hypothetical protein